MKKAIIIFTVMLSIISYSFTFTDVPQGHWAYNSLNKLYEKGIVRGKKFNGDEYASRYYFATVVARALDNMKNEKIHNSSADYEDFERINRLSIEFANELNLFGYRIAKVKSTLAELRKEIDRKKEEREDKKINLSKVKHSFSYDMRFRSEKVDFEYDNDDGSVDANDEASNDQVIGINWTVDFGNNLTYIQRMEHTFEHDRAAGNDLNIAGNTAITTSYFNYEENMYNFSIGRQFFAIGNALSLANQSNGIKYSKIVDENTDLVLMAMKDSNATNSSVNSYGINYLKYYDTSIVNYYFLNSTSSRWSTASTLISGGVDISSTMNYLGVGYKSEGSGLKYYAELSMCAYNDDVKDTATTGATGDIGDQFAFQAGLTKQVSTLTDFKFIYTHFDDFYKRYNVDPSITLPYYDELGYGGIYGAEALSDIRSAGFDSYFFRFENYLSLNSTLAFNLEFIKDDSTLGIGQEADDRMVYGFKFDKSLKKFLLSLEYTQVKTEQTNAPNDIKINGTGQESVVTPVTAVNALDFDGFDPIDQTTFRLTLTKTF